MLRGTDPEEIFSLRDLDRHMIFRSLELFSNGIQNEKGSAYRANSVCVWHSFLIHFLRIFKVGNLDSVTEYHDIADADISVNPAQLMQDAKS